jgi:hypothetical protein
VCDGCGVQVETPTDYGRFVGDSPDLVQPLGWHLLRGATGIKVDELARREAEAKKTEAYFEQVTQGLPPEAKEVAAMLVSPFISDEMPEGRDTETVDYVLDVCPKCLPNLPNIIRMAVKESEDQATRPRPGPELSVFKP